MAQYNQYSGMRGSIDIAWVIAECDRFFNSNQPELLGKHLRKYRDLAKEYGDKSGELSLLNELMGHYRMQCDQLRGREAVLDALKLIDELDLAPAASCGTILINAATALTSFGEPEDALKLYKRAEACYRHSLAADDKLFAGLFNNMASAFLALCDTEEACKLYYQALDILQKNHELMDAAVTYVNLAQLAYQLDREDEINGLLDEAMKLFDHPAAERNGYYAHTCCKCAPVFGFFCREADEKALTKRAEEFYANS